MTTVQEILHQVTIDRVSKKALLKFVTKLNDVELITKQDLELTTADVNYYYKLEKEYQNDVPIAYLIGQKEFYAREFRVTRDTLIPRPETEFLVAKAIDFAGDIFAKQDECRLLDLGTGSGVIAISCKLECPRLDVVAIDNSLQALAVALGNAKRLNAKVSFCKSNWYEDVTGKFDLIVSNPPYIAYADDHLAALQYEPIVALTDFADGFDCYRTIIASTDKYLNDGGMLLLEHGFDQASQINDLLISSNMRRIELVKDYAGLQRVTIAVKR